MIQQLNDHTWPLVILNLAKAGLLIVVTIGIGLVLWNVSPEDIIHSIPSIMDLIK